MFYVMVTIGDQPFALSRHQTENPRDINIKVIKQNSNIYIFSCKCSAELLQASPHHVGQTFYLLYFNDNSISNIIFVAVSSNLPFLLYGIKFPIPMTKTVVKFLSPFTPSLPPPPPPHGDMNESQSCSLPFHKENKLMPVFFFGGGRGGKGGLPWGMLISLNDQTEMYVFININ